MSSLRPARVPAASSAQDPATSPLIEVTDLTISYGDSDPSVRGVSLTLHAGEILGLIGESGSGKSTVAMAALGLLPRSARVQAERLDVCGLDIRTATRKQLTTLRGGSIAMVFQDAMGALDPCMRIGKQVAEVVSRHRGLTGRECRTEVRDLLDRVGLPDPDRQSRQYPHQLSGGLRQRAAIALALAGRPQVLLADEPTTALDVTVQAGILKLFREIRDDLGVGIVLVSHDMGVIAQTADRVAVMLDGEVMESGPVEQVLLTPRTAYARKLLDAAPTMGRDAPVNQDQSVKPDLITVEGVSRRFRVRGSHVTAVDNVTLTVEQGEVLGIVGESGSGKSTLAKMLVDLDSPSDGTMAYEGVEYGTRRRGFQGRVQMVFQHPSGSLNPRLRTGTSIREPIRSMDRQAARTRVAQLLAEVGLPEDSATRFPHEFSGGQKQRIAIARAISSSPRVVVLDEPTSALDVSVQAQVLDLLERVRAEHDLTYVFISHNLAVVRAVSDRVVVMYSGQVVEVGDSERVFTDPQHWYTKALVAAVPSADPRTRDIEPDVHVDEIVEAEPSLAAVDSSHACVFAARCPMAQERCTTEAPQLVAFSRHRMVRCHYPVDLVSSGFPLTPSESST